MDPLSHFLYQPREAQTGKKKLLLEPNRENGGKGKNHTMCVCACLMMEKKRALRGEEEDEEKLNGEEVRL